MKRKRPEDMKSSSSSKTQKLEEEKKMNLIVVGSGGREHVLTWYVIFCLLNHNSNIHQYTHTPIYITTGN